MQQKTQYQLEVMFQGDSLQYQDGSVKGYNRQHHEIKPTKNKETIIIFLVPLQFATSSKLGKPMWLQKACTMNIETKWPVLKKMNAE